MIREAVWLAHSRNNRRNGRLRRILLRTCTWLLFRKYIPLRWRQWWLFDGLKKCNRFILRCALWLQPISGGSIGNTFENDLLKLVFTATAIANLADNAASSPLTNLYVSLHTADPGDAGSQTTSETTYTSYARVAVARSASGWTVTDNSVSPTANVDFPAATGGSITVTYAAVGTALTGAGKILLSGAISPSIPVSSGVTPRLSTASTLTMD